MKSRSDAEWTRNRNLQDIKKQYIKLSNIKIEFTSLFFYEAKQNHLIFISSINVTYEKLTNKLSTSFNIENTK